jgi:hypothetical protein
MEREQTAEGTEMGGARKPNTITRSWLVATAGFPSQSSASQVGWRDVCQLRFHRFRLIRDKPTPISLYNLFRGMSLEIPREIICV